MGQKLPNGPMKIFRGKKEGRRKERRKMKKEKIWLVDMLIPRRFVESISKEVMDLYDEDVDTDTADEAVSQGATPEQATQAEPPL